MNELKFLRRQLIEAIQALAAELVAEVDGYFDQNFIATETIEEVLIVEHAPDNRIIAKLDEDYEYNFFNNLFYDHRLKEFYHYTSFSSLFYIINSGKLHLNSLVGLNDKSEIGLVNNFMGRNAQAKLDPVTMMYHNKHFIFCLSENKDQLNQWRLYGDDAAGVMIEFDIDHYHFAYRNILLSKITYNLKVFEIIKNWLDNCKNELGVHFGFYLIDFWKFFYKNEDYKDEAEIRLLIRNMDGDGHTTFPEQYKLNRYNMIVPYIEIACLGEKASFIKIKNIILGPKFNEADVNIAQLRYVLDVKYPGNEIRLLKSRIDHYR